MTISLPTADQLRERDHIGVHLRPGTDLSARTPITGAHLLGLEATTGEQAMGDPAEVFAAKNVSFL